MLCKAAIGGLRAKGTDEIKVIKSQGWRFPACGLSLCQAESLRLDGALLAEGQMGWKFQFPNTEARSCEVVVGRKMRNSLKEKACWKSTTQTCMRLSQIQYLPAFLTTGHMWF